MYKYLIFVFLFIAVNGAPKSSRLCTNENAFGTCAQKLFFIGAEKPFPENLDETNEFCSNLNDAYKCVTSYTTQCMSPEGRRATIISIAGVARLGRKLCRSDESKTNAAKHGSCANAIRKDLRQCLGEYKKSIFGAAKATKVEDKMPILCCKYNEFRLCARKAMAKVGDKVCPDASRSFMAQIAENVQSDVMDFTCHAFEDPSKCTKVVVPEVPQSVLKESIFVPLRQVIASIMGIKTDKKVTH